MRTALLLTTAVVLTLTFAVRAGGQGSTSRPRGTAQGAPSSLPPVLQTCPMHPDVLEDTPGKCPLCKMALVPVRLESVWSCPLHAAVTRDEKGTCPICRRELVQMTMALTWTCKARPDIDAIEPGRCPDGSVMVARRTLRPHGNHNPQHGGQFFMAPDNTHHLEGTLPSPRVFRIYLYDDYARPLPAARLRDVQGRVDIDGRSIPLVPVPSGSYLQGRLQAARFPARLTARLRLKAASPEYRFDFAFPAVTADPNAAPAAGRRAARPTTPRPVPTPSEPPAALTTREATIDPALIQVPIPADIPAILLQLRTRDGQIRELIDRGNLSAVFVPAFQARDLAVALEERLERLPAGRRDGAASAIADLVRAAWLLDSFGDIGDREQSLAAYALLHQSASSIAAAFASVK